MISAKQYFKFYDRNPSKFDPLFVREYTYSDHECGFIKPPDQKVLWAPLWPGGYLAYHIRKYTKKVYKLTLEWDDWVVEKDFSSVKNCKAYLAYFESYGDELSIRDDFKRLN